LNPRPQARYRQFYILSLAIWFDSVHANRRAGTKRVTLVLAPVKVTLTGTILCNLPHSSQPCGFEPLHRQRGV